MKKMIILVCLALMLCACGAVDAGETTAPAPQPETDGLIVYYDMTCRDGALLDRSGHENHAALHGSYEISDGALFLEGTSKNSPFAIWANLLLQ